MRKMKIAAAITIKHRVKAGEIEGMNIVGEIKGKHCIIVDDMIDTGLLSQFLLFLLFF